MGTTFLKKYTKVITTANGNAVPLFSERKVVYSVSIEMHQDSSVDDGWSSGFDDDDFGESNPASTMTSTNKNGQYFNKTTAVVEHHSRYRDGRGRLSNQIDASSIFVAADTGADILVTYMVATTEET